MCVRMALASVCNVNIVKNCRTSSYDITVSSEEVGACGLNER